MKRWMKKFAAVVATAAMVCSVGMPAFAAEDVTTSGNELSEEAITFLQEHNVDTSIFEISTLSLDEETQIANSYDESVLFLKNQTEAYEFTDEQIQAYVEGLVTKPTMVIQDETIAPYADNRPGDNGIGYEVKSKGGYYQETAFATLPTVNRAKDSTSPASAYMFYTLSNVPESWGIDVGLWYGSGNHIEAWRSFYKLPGGANIPIDNLFSLKAGDLVYFNGAVETNGYLRFRVLDGNDFSKVYVDISYYVGDKGIYRTNASFNRQISLCNDKALFNTGAYCQRAKFDRAYIYSDNGPVQPGYTNTESNRCGTFGVDRESRLKVSVIDSLEWYKEDVTITFK